MDDTQKKLEREVQELRTEVRRLRRLAEAAPVIIVLAIVWVLPQFALEVAGVGLVTLIALLVSPVRHLVFPSIFRQQKIVNRKS